MTFCILPFSAAPTLVRPGFCAQAVPYSQTPLLRLGQAPRRGAAPPARAMGRGQGRERGEGGGKQQVGRRSGSRNATCHRSSASPTKLSAEASPSLRAGQPAPPPPLAPDPREIRGSPARAARSCRGLFLRGRLPGPSGHKAGLTGGFFPLAGAGRVRGGALGGFDRRKVSSECNPGLSNGVALRGGVRGWLRLEAGFLPVGAQLWLQCVVS